MDDRLHQRLQKLEENLALLEVSGIASDLHEARGQTASPLARWYETRMKTSQSMRERFVWRKLHARVASHPEFSPRVRTKLNKLERLTGASTIQQHLQKARSASLRSTSLQNETDTSAHETNDLPSTSEPALRITSAPQKRQVNCSDRNSERPGSVSGSMRIQQHLRPKPGPPGSSQMHCQGTRFRPANQSAGDVNAVGQCEHAHACDVKVHVPTVPSQRSRRSASTKSSMLDLPTELLAFIMCYVGEINSLLNAEATCVTFWNAAHEAANNPWQAMCKRRVYGASTALVAGQENATRVWKAVARASSQQQQAVSLASAVSEEADSSTTEMLRVSLAAGAAVLHAARVKISNVERTSAECKPQLHFWIKSADEGSLLKRTFEVQRVNCEQPSVYVFDAPIMTSSADVFLSTSGLFAPVSDVLQIALSIEGVRVSS